MLRQTSQTPPAKPIESSTPKPVNVPLIRHEKEPARALANLYEELVVDVAEMSPEAAQYIRKRQWMTPELMKKWGVGWIPGNGRSLFRKNYIVYTHRNERGEVVSYSGRDLLLKRSGKTGSAMANQKGRSQTNTVTSAAITEVSNSMADKPNE